MLVVGIAIAVIVVVGILATRSSRASRRTATHRTGAAFIAFTLAAASILMVASIAGAAIVPTVPLGTTENYSVLGGQTVTNIGDSVLAGSVGVSPGTAITGFPPGVVQPPGIVDDGASATAAQAQLDLTAAYLNAAGRPLNQETTVDLSGLTLVGGVFASASKGPLELTGTLTLDGQGDPNSVFIFQTNSTLITGSGSSVQLINGAQQCNVFWQVGSSATLGTGSTFVGNILAQTSITVTNGVTVQGRALAQTGAVTLDNDVFNQPLCDLAIPTTTTTAGGEGATTTTPGGGGATTTGPVPSLPLTGSSETMMIVFASIAFMLGAGTIWIGRRQRR